MKPMSKQESPEARPGPPAFFCSWFIGRTQEGRVKIMKYEKPSVTMLAAAAEVIQGAGKGPILAELVDPNTIGTTGAYEADE